MNGKSSSAITPELNCRAGKKEKMVFDFLNRGSLSHNALFEQAFLKPAEPTSVGVNEWRSVNKTNDEEKSV